MDRVEEEDETILGRLEELRLVVCGGDDEGCGNVQNLCYAVSNLFSLETLKSMCSGLILTAKAEGSEVGLEARRTTSTPFTTSSSALGTVISVTMVMVNLSESTPWLSRISDRDLSGRTVPRTL